MPKTLLLADDSITIQRVVGITFANEDYEITTVDNGEDAVTKAKEITPDIILADVIMPKKNGYEVCEAVKNDPDLQHVPVLLLAGTFEAFDENRAREVGADGHITKPFESQALIDKVNELVGAAPSPGMPSPLQPVTSATPAAAATPEPISPQPAPTPKPAPATPAPVVSPAPPPPVVSPVPPAPISPPVTPEPKPLEPMPLEPMPLEPKPLEPKPLEPKPLEPKPLEPKPLEPKPLEPKPLEPKPFEPTPLEPKPLEPTPIEPAPVPTPFEPKPIESPADEPKPFELGPIDDKPAEPEPLDLTPSEPEPIEPAALESPAATPVPAFGASEPLTDLEPAPVEADAKDDDFKTDVTQPFSSIDEKPAPVEEETFEPKEETLAELANQTSTAEPAEDVELPSVDIDDEGLVDDATDAKPELAPIHEFIPKPDEVGETQSDTTSDQAAPSEDVDFGEEAAQSLPKDRLEAIAKEAIEKVVWEIVPQLAETILREEIEKLVKEKLTD
ncbi:MAG: response regulator [Deltaproteobacteria bacterium]|nr:response regulator [Deltaproteobacteria bacterium]